MDRIHIAQGRDQCRAPVNRAMIIRVSYNARNFLCGRAAVGFSRSSIELVIISK
jgi:hypothetical protein